MKCTYQNGVMTKINFYERSRVQSNVYSSITFMQTRGERGMYTDEFFYKHRIFLEGIHKKWLLRG